MALKTILELLGLGGRQPAAADSGETDTVRKIVGQLEAMPPEEARYIAAFAFILGRVANADLHISEEESREMERLVRELGGIDEARAVLVVGIAKSQNRLMGSTEGFLVTREMREIASVEQRRQLLDCLFAVSAADDSISTAEEAQIRQIASELGFTHRDYIEARSAYRDKLDVLRGLPGGSG